MNLTEKIKYAASELGYFKVGVTTADDFTEYLEVLQNRKNYGFYTQDKRGPIVGCQPKSVFSNAKSIICLAYNYGNIRFPSNLLGKVGRVYQGRCYNPPDGTMNNARLKLFKKVLLDNQINVLEGITLPERAAAARAGIVTYGKNNFAYAEGAGSFIVLTSLLVDVELDYDKPTVERPCPPSCTKCIDACPTHAIEKAGVLNPHRCIAYNHWNSRYAEDGNGHVPYDICEKMGERIFGCDVCQEVCPRNQKALKAEAYTDNFLNLISDNFHLGAVLTMDNTYYQNYIKPIMYNYISELKDFKRNAAIAIGNSNDMKYLPYLRMAMHDSSPLVKEYVVWALNKLLSTASPEDGLTIKEILSETENTSL